MRRYQDGQGRAKVSLSTEESNPGAHPDVLQMYKPQGRAVMYPNNPNDHVKMKNVEGLYSPLCIPHLAEGYIQKCEV